MAENKDEKPTPVAPVAQGAGNAPAAPAAADSQIDGEYHPRPGRTPAKAVFAPVTGDYRKAGSLRDYVEGIRKDFTAKYNQTKLVNWILLGLILVFVVGTVVAAFVSSSQPDNTWGNYVIWPLFAVTFVVFVVSLVFSSSFKKKNYRNIAVYLDRWANAMAASAYLDEGLSDLEYSCDAKVKDTDVINTHYWSRINAIDSRNRIVATYLGRELTDTEVSVSCPPYANFAKDIAAQIAAQTPVVDTAPAGDGTPAPVIEPAPPVSVPEPEDSKGRKSRKPVGRAPDIGAFGKLVSYGLKAKEGNTLIVTRTVSDSYLPTHVAGLVSIAPETVGLPTAFAVWASTSAFAREVLSPTISAVLSGLQTGTVLLDWFFAFNRNGTFFQFNYSDDIMELPVYVTPLAEKLDEYSVDAKTALKVFAELDKSGLGA